MVGYVSGEVITLFRCRRLLDRVVVVNEIRVPLVCLGAQESVEPLESPAQRPLAFGRRQVHLVFRREMPLADHERVPAALTEHLGDVAAFEGNVPARVREPGGQR